MSIILSSVLTAEEQFSFLKPALMALIILLAVLLLSSIIVTIISARAKGKTSRNKKMLLAMLYVATAVVLVCTILCTGRYNAISSSMQSNSTSTSGTDSTDNSTTESTSDNTTESTPVDNPEPTINPAKTDKTDPKKWNIKWNIYQGNTLLESYNRNEQISFGDASKYSNIEGIITFRGDNYRTGATFGTTNVVQETLTAVWDSRVGALKKGTGSGSWTGCGWTGQPLIVRWPEETKQLMNLYDDKKNKEGLVEVIYATMDGYIYFYDLEDGSYTRPKINMGMAFKGAGALDPRGYPLMYVGSGDNLDGKPARMYIVDLIEGKIIFEQDGKDSVTKRKWYAFDSAPLVDAETDTLIWPGENGVLYTVKLNTNYDKAAGTISIAPGEMIKASYSSSTGRSKGMESSAIIVDRYLYIGDNGGLFFCVNLDTMELVWCQNTMDDVNATPVFEWGEDGKGYIYTGSSMEYAGGTTYLHKLDAATGEILWEVKYNDVAFNDAVSGGVLSSPLLGKKGTNMEGLIIFTIARTPTSYGGILVALDTQTGEKVWEKTLKRYAWSSPTGVYTEDGKGYFILCDSAGNVSLYNGATGEVVNQINLGSNIEASPAVFEDMLVVGTRGQKVCGIKIS
ncbi:MAG: PQQ-binding-like beta-propeller repeat protein [Oscillospiraceae bacterium]|nr:PQQ-binding-like beta-propeller repeat protein [Oscillospiraceae bacterium]